MRINSFLFKDKFFNVTKHQLIYPPDYDFLDASLYGKLKLTISRILKRKVPFEPNYLFWTSAILTIGFEWGHRLLKRESDLQTLILFYKKIVDRFSIEQLKTLDATMTGYTLIYLESIVDDKSIKYTLDSMAVFLTDQHPKTIEGILPYRANKMNMLLVDTLAMICPFLSRYWNEYGDSKALELCVQQITEFIEKGIDKSLCLPYHGYLADSGKNIGLLGWGRGVGWLLIGLVDSLEYIPKNHSNYHLISNCFMNCINSVKKYQDKRGYLHWNLLDEKAHVDSSATAMFGYSIIRGINLKILDYSYLKYANKSLNALNCSTNMFGMVNDCSGECNGPGRYSEFFGFRSWAQGPAYALAVLLEDMQYRLPKEFEL